MAGLASLIDGLLDWLAEAEAVSLVQNFDKKNQSRAQTLIKKNYPEVKYIEQGRLNLALTFVFFLKLLFGKRSGLALLNGLKQII